MTPFLPNDRYFTVWFPLSSRQLQITLSIWPACQFVFTQLPTFPPFLFTQASGSSRSARLRTAHIPCHCFSPSGIYFFLLALLFSSLLSFAPSVSLPPPPTPSLSPLLSFSLSLSVSVSLSLSLSVCLSVSLSLSLSLSVSPPPPPAPHCLFNRSYTRHHDPVGRPPCRFHEFPALVTDRLSLITKKISFCLHSQPASLLISVPFQRC